MSKVHILFTQHISSGQIKLLGVVSKTDVAEKFYKQSENDYELNNYINFELDDPELLNRIAKEGEKNMEMITESKEIIIEDKGDGYKGPINIPCSACSAGDTKMEYHTHQWVPEKDRRK